MVKIDKMDKAVVTFVVDHTHLWPYLQKYGQQSILIEKKKKFSALINF